jgi:hypothetical protein
MKTQKAIAIVMVLSGSVLTAWASRDITFPAILCMLGLLGLRRRFPWSIGPERRVITSLLLLVLAILFALHYRYVSSASRVAHEQAAAVAWQTIARYFLASMILVLFLRCPERLPVSLALFYLATVISVGQVLLLEDLYVAFRLSEVLAVILLVLYAAGIPARGKESPLSQGRQTRHRVALGVILLVATNSGWMLGSLLYRHVEVLNFLPTWFWEGGGAFETTTDGVAHIGFSKSGRLNSLLLVKGDQDPTPVLSITSESNPGYLRARAFEIYRRSEWHDWSHREAVLPEQSNPFGVVFVGRTSVFRLADRSLESPRYVTVKHVAPITDAIFTPLGTLHVEAPLSLVLQDDNDILYPSKGRQSLSYRVAYAPSGHRKRPGVVHRHRMLNVPDDLDPRVHALARRLFAGRQTTADKISAVIDHFRRNYSYSLGLDVPPARDRLTHFLLEESYGYCEYFASGAALLLRLADVPTRYVTGFLVTEKDPEGQNWVARNMDAHAWAEAWDQQRGQWTIVEATVPEGLGSLASSDESLGNGEGSGGMWFRQLTESLHQYGLFGLIGWVLGGYRGLAYVLVLGVLLAAIAWRKLSGRRHEQQQRAGAARAASREPCIVALHRSLARMDRRVKRAGCRRRPDETLHAFAARLGTDDAGDGSLTSVSRWYRRYADLRYARVIAPEHVNDLTRHARDLARSR